MFYDHKKKEILDFIKECYQLTFDTTRRTLCTFTLMLALGVMAPSALA